MTVLTIRNSARNGPVGAAGIVVCFQDTQDQPLLLGASHIFAPAGAQPGDELIDITTGRAVAQLADWTGLTPGEGYPNRASAALATPLLSAADLSRLSRIPFARGRPAPAATLSPDAPSRAGPGALLDAARECVMTWQEQATGRIFRFGLTDQIICAQIHQIGDAGAPVFDGSGGLVGIVVGMPGLEGALGLAYTAVSPIDSIAQHRAWQDRRLIPFGLAPTIPAAARITTPTDRDLDTLARTMWGEARGETATLNESFEAVAWVVRNRLAAGRPRSWGKTVDEVCRKPWQFSCWNANDPNLPQMRAIPAGNAEFALALQLARSVLDGQIPDLTEGATHYHAVGSHPAWETTGTFTIQIGHHRFYKGVP